MKKSILPAILIIAFGLTAFAQKTNDKSSGDKDAIKAIIITAYEEGLQNEGDFNKIDKGFHPGFELLGIGQGDEMWELPIYTWKQKTKKKLKDGKLPRTGEDKVSLKFPQIDVSGTAGMAKVEFFTGDKLTYIDYLLLYKFESGWKIVSKIFYQVPKK